MLSWFRGRKAKARLKPQRRRTFLGMEGLEDRSLLAGFVDVSISGGTLYLRGDAASNGVAVVGTATPGQFNVIAVDNVVGAATPGDVAAPTTLRVNGVADADGVVTVNNVVNINADLGAGNDQIGVTGAAGAVYYGALLLAEYAANTIVTPPVPPAAGSSAALQGSITIATGAGNDAVALLVNTPSTISVDTGVGNDYAVVESSTTLNMAINTGAGDTATNGSDRVRVRDTDVTIALGINTYAGNDVVDVFGSSAQTIGINTYDNGGLVFVGVDPLRPEAVRLIGVQAQTVGVNTHGGADQVIVASAIAPFSTETTTIGNLTINTGDGDDQVLFNPGAGTTVFVTQQATITTGGGNDEVNTSLLQVGSYLWVDLGAGNDSFAATSTLASYSYITGGSGDDTFTDGGGNDPLNLFLFEIFV